MARKKLPCPKCQNSEVRVENGVKPKRIPEGIIRRYVCPCGEKFVTLEDYYHEERFSNLLPAEPLRKLLIKHLDQDPFLDTRKVWSGEKRRLREQIGMSSDSFGQIYNGNRKTVQRYNGELWVKALGYSPFEVWPDHY